MALDMGNSFPNYKQQPCHTAVFFPGKSSGAEPTVLCCSSISFYTDWECAIYAQRVYMGMRACTQTRRMTELEIRCLRPVVFSDGNGWNLLVVRAGFLVCVCVQSLSCVRLFALTLYTNPCILLSSCKHCWPHKEGKGGTFMNHMYKTNESSGHGVLAGSYSSSD